MKPRIFTIVICLLAILATGCKKDNNRIRIFAESMGGSKVFIDTTTVNSATWVDGETINLNGTTCTIAVDDDGYYINSTAPLSGTKYAVYPATVNTYGNHIVVSNSGTACTITLHSLDVNFHDNGHDIVFPMAAKAGANSNRLMFQHLTGGIKLTLSARTECSIYSVKVITYGTGAAPNVTLNDATYTVRWDSQGPNLPAGNVGGIAGDRDVKYASKMVLSMNGGNGVIVSTGTTFFVPVTINNIRRITVIGYDSNGNELFSKTQAIDPTIEIERNKLYTIPTILIN